MVGREGGKAEGGGWKGGRGRMVLAIGGREGGRRRWGCQLQCFGESAITMVIRLRLGDLIS